MSITTWEWATEPLISAPDSVLSLKTDSCGGLLALLHFQDGDQGQVLFLPSEEPLDFEGDESGSQWSEVSWIQAASFPETAEIRERKSQGDTIYLALIANDNPGPLWTYQNRIYQLLPGAENWEEMWTLPILRSDRPRRIALAVLATPVAFALDMVTLPIQAPIFLVMALRDRATHPSDE